MKAPKTFSNRLRAEQINSLSTKLFDILIIGGGITGAGIALEAVSRGFSVALIEKDDFASQTSGNSTKLIHGGLRYLKNFEFSLVRKSAIEREIVFQNAAHLVVPSKIMIPIFKNNSIQKLMLNLALTIYEILGKVNKHHKHYFLSKEETIKREPSIQPSGLTGSAIFYEYKTDDARLTIEVVKTAHQFGAIALNYCNALQLLKENFKVTGVIARDELTNNLFEIKAHKTINATGAFVQELHDNPSATVNLKFTKGVHMVIPKNRLNLSQAIYFETVDKRMIFAIPKQNHIYIGTTDTFFEGEKHKVITDNSDITYLLNAANFVFPQARLVHADVVSSWAGLRTLAFKPNKKASELSRKDEVWISESGLISVAGGKLTGYRLIGIKIVDLVQGVLRNSAKSITHQIKLSGGDFDFDPQEFRLIELNDKKFDEVKQTGISVDDFKTLFYRYGTNIDLITEKAYEMRGRFSNTEENWLAAEVWYALEYEMVFTLKDFFIRRTSKIHFNRTTIVHQINFVSTMFKEFFSWNEETLKQNLAELNEILNHSSVI